MAFTIEMNCKGFLVQKCTPNTVVYPHTNTSGNIIRHNLRTSMNEWIHFFIKISISHTLFSKGLMLLWCVREGWRQRQTAILTKLLLLTIALCVIFKNPLSTSSASWRDLLNRGSLRATAFSVYKLAFLSSTDSTAAGICLYSFLMSTCFRFFFGLFTQVHLWLTARSRVNIQQ